MIRMNLNDLQKHSFTSIKCCVWALNINWSTLLWLINGLEIAFLLSFMSATSGMNEIRYYFQSEWFFISSFQYHVQEQC